MLMGWIQKRLLALSYPDGGSSFDIENINHIQTLVAWLEDTKIRFYAVEDRTPLRTMDQKWFSVFQEYLKQLGCPHKIKEPLAGNDKIVVVDWILSHAIGLAYRDNVESINQQSQKYKEAKQSSKVPIDTSDYNSVQFKTALASLAQLLQIPLHDDPTVLLNTLQKAVKSKFSESVFAQSNNNNTNNNNNNNNAPSGLQVDTSVSEEKFPLGFNTGEKQTNMASTILRLLYIKDLRELQTNINDLIVAVQSFTSNPVTNTVLGKVGR